MSKEPAGQLEWERKPKGALRQGLAPWAGFGVTLRTLFSKPVTEQYPFEKVPPKPRYHGRHRLGRHPDGLEKCVGCELCAWACPAQAIHVEAGDNTPDEQYSPGERYGRIWEINYLRCIFCGLCIEACPTGALTMTTEYELAGPTREGLVYGKEQILAPAEPGMLAAPHPEAEGAAPADYYAGAVAGPTEGQIAWVRERRPDDPSLAAAGPQAVKEAVR